MHPFHSIIHSRIIHARLELNMVFSNWEEIMNNVINIKKSFCWNSMIGFFAKMTKMDIFISRKQSTTSMDMVDVSNLLSLWTIFFEKTISLKQNKALNDTCYTNFMRLANNIIYTNGCIVFFCGINHTFAWMIKKYILEIDSKDMWKTRWWSMKSFPTIAKGKHYAH